jgi:hypothetical protein
VTSKSLPFFIAFKPITGWKEGKEDLDLKGELSFKGSLHTRAERADFDLLDYKCAILSLLNGK